MSPSRAYSIRYEYLRINPTTKEPLSEPSYEGETTVVAADVESAIVLLKTWGLAVPSPTRTVQVGDSPVVIPSFARQVGRILEAKVEAHIDIF